MDGNGKTRLIQAALLALFFSTAGFGQQNLTNKQVLDTTPTLPAHYADKIIQFEKEPVLTGRVIFLGNSITEMANWGALLGDSSVLNRGIGGDNTYGVLKRLSDIIIRQPTKLFILIGINDISKDIPEVLIADNLRKIIERLRRESPYTKIYLESILPVNPDLAGFPQHYDKNPHILVANSLIEQLAKDTRVVYIDTYALFNDGTGKLKKEFTREGLHLNPRGYEAFVKFLKDQGYF
jgi:lysophospholipase L1-like esterase